MADWKFVTNHGHVLALIAEVSQITEREMSDRLGITERSVQRIISDLEKENYISREKVGRRNRYTVNPAAPFRRANNRHGPIEELLRLMTEG